MQSTTATKRKAKNTLRRTAKTPSLLAAAEMCEYGSPFHGGGIAPGDLDLVAAALSSLYRMGLVGTADVG